MKTKNDIARKIKDNDELQTLLVVDLPHIEDAATITERLLSSATQKELEHLHRQEVGAVTKNQGKQATAASLAKTLIQKEKIERETGEAPEPELAEAEPVEETETAPVRPQAAHMPPEAAPVGMDAEATSDAPNGNDTPQETPLTKLSIPELQSIYAEVVGRPTGSSARNYLIWKVKQAMKGRIPVGHRCQRSAGTAGPHKVLPLRMEVDMVKQLDETRERLGLPSRMELFRRALHLYLDKQGEAEAAALFAPEA